MAGGELMGVQPTAWRTAAAGLMILAIAIVDWRVEFDVAFGFLYVFPLILVGTASPRWAVAVVAALCTALADIFDPYPFTAVSVPHDILVFLSLAGTGLFAQAVTRSRELAREAEEQFTFLVHASAAAILMMTDDGEIRLANAAANRLFRASDRALVGQNVRDFLPALSHLRSRSEDKTIQSAMECRGRRAAGEGFLAEVFFSRYDTAAGPRIAAVVIDVSDALREREISELDQLLAGSRIVVGAVFHEVRNLCSAIAVNYETLIRTSALVNNKSAESIGALVATLTRMTEAVLREGADSTAGPVNVTELVADLRLVVDGLCADAGVTIEWNVPGDLPNVVADPHRLLQVLLNLMRNSERALSECSVKKIDVTAVVEKRRVSIRVTDSGPGLPASTRLFEPFQAGAESSGLGLYLSRALLRSFGGDLRHDPLTTGCAFVIDLVIAP
jgi:PAS domain S-box-containing protein